MFPFISHATFYFVYFATLGLFLPFWSVYLRDRGLSHFEVALLISASLAVKVVALILWGWVADKKYGRLSVIRWGAFFTWFVFLLVFLKMSFYGLFAVMASFWFFWNAILAQFEVLVLRLLQKKHAETKYSRIRLWGSIGFFLTVLWGGAIIEWINIKHFPYLILFGTFSIWIASLSISESGVSKSDVSNLGEKNSAAEPVIKNILPRSTKKNRLFLFLLAAFLMQVAYGPYYTFFSLYLMEHYYSLSDIGSIWALGVFAEIIFFIFLPKFCHKISHLHWMQIGLLAGAIRWVIIQEGVENIGWLVFAQAFHALNFGAFHVGAINWVNEHFSEGMKGRGQAIYSAFTYGLGGAVGAYIAGVIWDAALINYLYLFSSVMCLLGLLVSIKLSNKTHIL